MKSKENFILNCQEYKLNVSRMDLFMELVINKYKIKPIVINPKTIAIDEGFTYCFNINNTAMMLRTIDKQNFVYLIGNRNKRNNFKLDLENKIGIKLIEII